MNAPTLAFFYAVFMVFFLVLNLTSLNTSSAGNMYKSVLVRYRQLPYTNRSMPERYLDNIETPSELVDWLQRVFASVTYEEQKHLGTTVATVGSFNRILLTRFSGKRRKLDTNNQGQFKAGSTSNSYPKKLVNPAIFNARSKNFGEDTEQLCATNSQSTCVVYSAEANYGTGGYSNTIDPTTGEQQFLDTLSKWTSAGFFDRKLATFTVDTMAYNTNVDLFMHIEFTFRFDFAGRCTVSIDTTSFNLNIFNTKDSTYLAQYIFRFVLVIMVIFFFANEMNKIRNVGIYQHINHPSSFVDFFSLILCAAVLISYWTFEQNKLFKDFQFAQLSDPATQEQTYNDLVKLGGNIEGQRILIAINLLVVFIRAVVMVAELHPNLGLLLNVLERCIPNLTYFLILFLMVMTGFAFFAYFTFGAGYHMTSNIGYAFFTCFAMLTGKEVLDAFIEADAAMAQLFYYIFYILFYLVMINVFVSILLSGYDSVDHEMAAERSKKKER